MAAAPAGPRGTGAARRALAPPLQRISAPVTALPHLARPLGRGGGAPRRRAEAWALRCRRGFPAPPPRAPFYACCVTVSSQAVHAVPRRPDRLCRRVTRTHANTHIRSFSSWSRARVANGSSRSRGSVGGLFPILSAGTTHHSPAVGRLPRRRVGWRVAVPGTGCGPLGATYLRTCTLYLYALMRPLMISCLYFSISSSFSNVA